MKNYLKLMLLLLGATIALQGFQCSSREMTTAKVAIQQGDDNKAIENLQAEIDKNPKNAEAFIMLAELKVKKGDFATAAQLMDKAEPLCANDPKLKDKPAQFKFNFFKSAIESGEQAFNRYTSNKSNKQLENAIKHFNTALTFRPQYAQAYRMIGVSYEFLEKPDSATAAYLKYVEIMQPSIDIAVKNNIFTGAEINKLVQKVGAGTFIRGNKAPNGNDSTVFEHYKVEGKDLYVMSTLKKNSTSFDAPKIESWSYDPPTNILQAEREIIQPSMEQPIISLATLYYTNKDATNSLKYFNLVTSISPYNDNANSAIVTLYQELGRSDEAVAAIEENVRKNPGNPIFVAQLGDIYMNQNDYDKAIEQYEKAIALKSDFSGALRNVGACYGNKAAKVQQEQNDLLKDNKIKQVDINTYLPLLTKAADYFNKTLATTEFKNDPDVLGDLCAIYMVIPDEKANFNKTLKQLEDLESVVAANKKEAYYMRLYKIYGAINSPKLTEIENKIK